MSLTRYSGNRNASSWAFRAWLALREQNIDFDEIIIDIRRPQRWSNLFEIGKFSPPAAVPSVLRLKAHHPVPSKYPMTIAWMQRLLNRPHVKEWLTDAYALEPIYCEGYYSS